MISANDLGYAYVYGDSDLISDEDVLAAMQAERRHYLRVDHWTGYTYLVDGPQELEAHHDSYIAMQQPKRLPGDPVSLEAKRTAKRWWVEATST